MGKCSSHTKRVAEVTSFCVYFSPKIFQDKNRNKEIGMKRNDSHRQKIFGVVSSLKRRQTLQVDCCHIDR